MKIFSIAVILFLLSIQLSQAQEESITIDRLVREIGNLEAEDLMQTASRSKAEACALRVRFGYPTDDPPGEEVMMLRISDLNEDDIDIEYNEDAGEWDLSIYCNELERRVLVVDEDFGDSYESSLMISDKDQAVLLRLKETLVSAIRECKARD